MGVLDEVPNLGNQFQTWGNFWQNQNKWNSEREAGEAASTGNWDEAQRRALARGNVDLYKDYHNIQQVTQQELGQKILATVQAAKTPQQYHAIIDTMSQHGVPGLSKYRVPPGGDFDTTKNAALAELGQYNEYLKYQQDQQKQEQERQKFELEKRKATYLGTMTVPGAPAVSRETGPANLPRQEAGYLPAPAANYLPGASAGTSQGATAGAAGATAGAPEGIAPSMSLADISSKLHAEMGSRGLGEAAKPPVATTPAGKEKKFLVSTLATGEPVYHELPEGAEFEGKGTKAKPNLEMQIFESLKADAIEKGTYTNDSDIWSQVAQHVKTTKQRDSAGIQEMKYMAENPQQAAIVERFYIAKKGGEKSSPIERAAVRLQAEAAGMGERLSYSDALDTARKAIKGEGPAMARLNALMGPRSAEYIDAIRQEHVAQGKEPEAMQLAHAMQQEAIDEGRPAPSIEEAYKKSMDLGGKRASDVQLMQYLANRNPNATKTELDKEFTDLKTRFTAIDREREALKKEEGLTTAGAIERQTELKTKETATERELADIKRETGADTIGAIAAREKAKAKAISEGRSVPQIFAGKGKDASGKEVEGTIFINPVTQKEEFIPHPAGVTDIAKFSARNNRMNAELDEIEKIKKEKGVDELEAIRLRTEAKSATKNPSAELQGINALRAVYPNENIEQLTKRWVNLHEKKTDYDKKLAAIMDAHPGENKEDAMIRAEGINKLTVIKRDPATGEFKAVPIEGTIEQQKLAKPLSSSDLKILADAYKRDERFKDMPEVDRIAMAKGVLTQKGYNVHIDDSGNAVYQIAENSKAQMDQTRTYVAKEMADIRKRVATEPQLKFQMKFADEAAKNDVKTMGREAQTVVVDNHIKGVENLAGTLSPKTEEEKRKRRVLDGAVGLLTSGLSINRLKEMANRGSSEAMAARSLLSYKMALQSETARLLSMGMTGNIAHEHAKELGQIVGDLDKVPSVDALLTQLKTLKEITSAIRTLPMIPGDPIEAQKMINERGSMSNADHDTAKKWADEISGPGSTGTYTAKDGKLHKFQKTLNPKGDGVTVIYMGVEE